MKRAWYLYCLITAIFCTACSEDVEKPASLTLEQRILQPTAFSFYLWVDETITEGTAYSAIQEETKAALTIGDVKQHSSGIQMTIRGGGPYIASFKNLSPQTSYLVSAYVEVDGVASDLAMMKVTTP